MKKLLLINPVEKKSGLLLSRFSTFPPLGLACLAGVTPDTWEVKIIDENFQNCEFEEADLVGITAFTSSINRAYEIAGLFRSQGVKVVIGGIHASMVPLEVGEYADSVVVGEGESIWPEVLQDAESGNLKKEYWAERIDLSLPLPHPRRDLLDSRYVWQAVQTSRGCPFACVFCSVTSYLGSAFRQRPVEDVLDEIESLPGRYVTFFDDNLIGYTQESRDRAKALFRGMIDRKMEKVWWMQTSINAADDLELLDLAAKSGCLIAFIGFETIDIEGLKRMHKGMNVKIGVENYKKVIQRFHSRGIGIMGGFIIGSDFESPSFYRKLARYLMHSGVDIPQITILTPLPGTRLYEEMESEKRLLATNFPEDWKQYRFSRIVYQLKGVTEEQVYRGNNYIKRRLFSPLGFAYRMCRSFVSLRNFKVFKGVYAFNRSLKQGWMKSWYYGRFPLNLDD